MLNMRVVTNEESTAGTTEAQGKQKGGHRLQAAILRNIHHERKLKMECEALQKARKLVENDIRQIEQKLQKGQRHPASQEHYKKNSITSPPNARKLAIERAHPSSRMEQNVPKARALPGGVSHSRNTDGDNRMPVKLKEDSKTFPAYEQRFLNMLDSSQVDKSNAESIAFSPKVARRSLFSRSFSIEHSELADCDPKERGIDGNTGVIKPSDDSEVALGDIEVVGEKQKMLYDEKHTKELGGYSRHLVKMDHIVRRRQSGADDMERAINDSLVHLSSLSLGSLDRMHEKPRLAKYQEPISPTGAFKHEWRGNERRNSTSICGKETLTRISDLNANNMEVHGGEFIPGLREMPRRASNPDADIKRLSLNGISVDSIVEYRKKISNPTITKRGDVYDQEGCFITSLRKTKDGL